MIPPLPPCPVAGLVQNIRPHVWYLVVSHCNERNSPPQHLRIEVRTTVRTIWMVPSKLSVVAAWGLSPPQRQLGPPPRGLLEKIRALPTERHNGNEKLEHTKYVLINSMLLKSLAK